MIINGREVNFFYSVRAHCEYDEYVIANQNKTMVEAIVKKAVIMHRAWIAANGSDIKPITEDEIMDLPNYVFEELKENVFSQEKEDSKRTVETEESPKNGKRAKV